MRKTVVILILVLPILFVFVLFSAGNVVSLNIPISVNGIKILDKPENGIINFDLAEYENDYTLQVDLSPEKASNKDFSYSIEKVDESELANIEISEQNKIIAKTPGIARVRVISNDGGYSDSVLVVVGTSKAIDFDLSLSNYISEEIKLDCCDQNEYFAQVVSGRYNFKVNSYPSGFKNVDIKLKSGFAEIEKATGNLLLPFEGITQIVYSIEDGLKGKIEKTLTFDVKKLETTSNFTINGGAEKTITVAKNNSFAKFYLEAENKPIIKYNDKVGIISAQVNQINGMRTGCYEINVEFEEIHDEKLSLNVAVGDKTEEIEFVFKDFGFSIYTDYEIQSTDSIYVLAGQKNLFYAIPMAYLKGVKYVWETDRTDNIVKLFPGVDGKECQISISKRCNFMLKVTAYQNGEQIFVTEREINALNNITSVSFSEVNIQGDHGIVGCDSIIGGKRYVDNHVVKNKYPLNISAFNVAEVVQDFIEDFEFSTSNSSIAEVVVENNLLYLIPAGKNGNVTISAKWKGNETFCKENPIIASKQFSVVSEAVEVGTNSELYEQMREKNPVVLTSDIMLGSKDKNENGEIQPLSIEERKEILNKQQITSTYNTEYFKTDTYKQNHQVDGSETKLKYALNITNDIYGNGHILNAEFFTNAKNEEIPILFQGPLNFVALQKAASVKGQDNIAFMINTDDVTLYNLSLLGCNDDALQNGTSEEYYLSYLQYVGTTLDINANNTNLINCRVRNGRNVVRVYGGNKNGDKYFIDSVEDYLKNKENCDKERIKVNIEGCILMQAREFVLKIGTNRAVRANSLNVQPDLKYIDENGDFKSYKTQTNDYVSDSDFYKNYVLTDVTLKDSLIETSGLFTIGIESNFSGNALSGVGQVAQLLGIFSEDWNGTGGTSFASILRMKGDVRIFDWKDLEDVDSSTLIEGDGSASGGLGSLISLNLKEMLRWAFNVSSSQESLKNCSDIIDFQNDREPKYVVHGGIAFYGGGKNYSQITFEGMSSSLANLKEYYINISILKNSQDSSMQTQGQLLPEAAGNEDFRFYMYQSGNINSYEKQLQELGSGIIIKAISIM